MLVIVGSRSCHSQRWYFGTFGLRCKLPVHAFAYSPRVVSFSMVVVPLLLIVGGIQFIIHLLY